VEGIKLRKARIADMPLIESCIEEFRLDSEDIKCEQFVVAEKAGSVVGFGRIKPYRYCFELGCLTVIETYRNRGIGGSILKRLIHDFPSDDIWITTDIPEYFGRFGFQPTAEAPEEIVDKIRRVCESRQHPNAVIMLLRTSNAERLCQ